MHKRIPYQMYGDYCLASVMESIEYKKLHKACGGNNHPSPYKEEMRDAVILALKNSFLGGGVLMNIRKKGFK